MKSAETLKYVLTLLELSAQGADITEIQTTGLEMITDITNSEGGYLHTFDENENAIDLCLWSRHVMATCQAVASSHYPLESAGIWADCVRLRRPVIHNNYQDMPKSKKRGMPENHFPLYRHLSVPVFSQSRIVSIAGVGNKTKPYTRTDTTNAKILAEVMWAITEQRNAQAVLEEYAFEDALTGIGNRRRFDAVLREEWDRHRRQKAPLGLIMYDLDFFKLLNDKLGHDQGDICLQQVAAILRKTFRRAGEVVCRYGGEEFMVILPAASLEATRERAEAGRQNLQDAGIENPGSPLGDFMTVSAGAVSVIPVDDNLMGFEKAADRNLYKAKLAGRN